MKNNYLRILSIVIFITMLPIGIHAQWYTRYRVRSAEELSEDQCKAAIDRADYRTMLGAFFAIGGGIGLVLGSLMLIFPDTSNGMWYDSSLDEALAAMCLGGRAIFGLIGIPILITGIRRNHQIKGLLSGFPAKVFFNPYYSRGFNHHSMGLTLSFSF